MTVIRAQLIYQMADIVTWYWSIGISVYVAQHTLIRELSFWRLDAEKDARDGYIPIDVYSVSALMPLNCNYPASIIYLCINTG